MASKKIERSIFGAIGPGSIFIIIVSMLVLTLVGIKLQQTRSITPGEISAQVVTKVYGIQFDKGFLANKDQPITLTGSIYTGTEAPDIPVGATVLMGVSTVGSGMVQVNDSRNNVYTLVKQQKIDSEAWVYLFKSTLTTALKAYDNMSVTTTSATSIAASGFAFTGNAGQFTTSGQSGYNTSPKGPEISYSQGDLVVVIYGFRAKTGDFGESYDPIVQGVMGASSGSQGNSLNNSRLTIHNFVAPSNGSISLPLPISNVKSKNIPWGAISIAFH